MRKHRNADPAQEPLILTVPDVEGQGPGHWQNLWEQQLGDCQRVDLGSWDEIHRNNWVNKLNHSIYRAGRPVVLVAHGIGSLVLAWWAKLEPPSPDRQVAGALLVAPPDVDFFPSDDRLSKFAPTPSLELPFPSILVASRNDPQMSFLAARRLARVWGSRFVDAGEVGHIDEKAGLGGWRFGQNLLRKLLKGQASSSRGDGSDAARDAAGTFRSAHGWEAPAATPDAKGLVGFA